MKAAIFLNSPDRAFRRLSAERVICCDGGLKLCPVKPDVLIGDFDSLTSPVPDGVEIVRHNPHKNASDGELAVRFAQETLHADELVFYGVQGGRYDHVLGNFAIMALAGRLGMKTKAEEDGLDIHYAAKGRFVLDTQKGDLISVIPHGGDALVSDYSNLEYPLKNLLLRADGTRGISNVSLGGLVSLDIEKGEVFVFRYSDALKD